MAAEEAQRVEQEAQARAALLIGQDLGIGQPGMVVDGQVQVFPADPPGLGPIGSITGDAMACSLEAAELLGIDVDQLAGMLAA